VDSLSDFGNSSASAHVKSRIEELHGHQEELRIRIHELETRTARSALSDVEFALMGQLLAVFRSSIDRMTVEQKRAALRLLVRKVIWDGQCAHVVLFGTAEKEWTAGTGTPAAPAPDDTDNCISELAFANAPWSEDSK